MAKQNYGGVYANMDFPPYEFREFPKHIPTGDHGRFEVAQNAREEKEIRDRLKLEYDNAPAENTTFHAPDPVREALIGRAAQLKTPINRKWSIDKLKAVIAEAEKAMDDLPPDENENEVAEETHPRSATNLTLLSGQTAVPEELDYDALLAKAKSLGINADKRWSEGKLKHAIEQAEAE